MRCACPSAACCAQEIEDFCKQASGGATEADPFEGMTPQVGWVAALGCLGVSVGGGRLGLR